MSYTQSKPTDIQPGGYPGNWTGKFIWDDGPPAPKHFFLMFRKEIHIKKALKSAILHITAADKYHFYLNGKYLGRGPGRSVGPQWTVYDSYDITSCLVSGKNIIAVQAYYHGGVNGYSVGQRSGFWAQIELADTAERIEIIGTDQSWKIRHAEGYRRDVKAVNGFHGIMTEVYDANFDSAQWNTLDYNDLSWKFATEVSSCWSYLEPRITPMMREREIKPIAIPRYGEVKELPKAASYTVIKDTDVPERLAAEKHYPLTYAIIKNSDALLSNGQGEAIFKSHILKPPLNAEQMTIGTRDPYIILDFGSPVFGFPKIEFDAPAHTVVEMSYTNELIDNRAVCLEECSRLGDAYIACKGRQVWQLFDGRPFRYLQVVFRNVANQLAYHPGDTITHRQLLSENDCPIRVKSINVIVYEFPADTKGRFECSDSILTELWRKAVNTAYLHIEDTVIMDFARERVLYPLVGEMEQINLALSTGYGDIAVTDLHFRQTSRMQTVNGQFPIMLRGGLANPDFEREIPQLEANPQSILNYMSFYGLSVRNRYHYVGRIDFLREHYPVLIKLAGWCKLHTNHDGLLENLPGWNWFDWVKNEMAGANFETNAVYCSLLLAMEEIAAWLGLDTDASKWQEDARKVKMSLRNLYWNNKAGLFADSVLDGKQVPVYTELANAFALLFDIATEKQKTSIVARLTDLSVQEHIVHSNVNGAACFEKAFKDSNIRITCPSPLYVYYLVDGLTKAGATDYALKYLSKRFRKMMNPKCPGLKETWLELPTLHSIGAIHAGSAGVAWYLTKCVLGIQATEPGFKKCRIQPECGNLTWAKGVLPTVRGRVEVSWERKSDLFRLKINLPENMETEVVLPFATGKTSQVKLDGNELTAVNPLQTGGYIIINDKVVIKVGGGKHEFRIS